MPIKLINMGESTSGKTTALEGLCRAGFNVRVMDFDNGVEALCNLLNDSEAAQARLRFKTFKEPMRVLNGQIFPRAATVWPGAVAMLEKWQKDQRYDNKLKKIVDCEDSLGSPYNWTDQDVLVCDTLTKLGERAVEHKLMFEGKLGDVRSQMESMKDAGSGQLMLMKFLGFLADASLPCNVIINTHLNWCKENGENAEFDYKGERYGFPAAIGKALNLKVPRDFNHMLLTRIVGVERRIYTRGVANVGLKSGNPKGVKESYKHSTGLAEYFKDCGIVPAGGLNALS